MTHDDQQHEAAIAGFKSEPGITAVLTGVSATKNIQAACHRSNFSQPETAQKSPSVKNDLIVA